MAVILIIALLFVACNDKTGLPSSTVDTTEDIVLNDNTSHAPETITKENSQKNKHLNIKPLFSDYDSISVVSPCCNNGDGSCCFGDGAGATETTYKPYIWMLNSVDGTSEKGSIIYLDGFRHIHTANINNDEVWFFTAVDDNNKCYVLKYHDNEIVSKIKIDRLPDKTYIFDDTVILLQKNTDCTGKLFKVNFDNEKIGVIAENLYCSGSEKDKALLSDSSNVFTYENKIFYRTGISEWNLYSENTTKSYPINGYCGGFLDGDSVVFYCSKTGSLPVYSKDKFCEIGEIKLVTLNDGKAEKKKTIKVPFGILNSMAISSNGENLLVEYGTLDDNHNGIIINMNTYSVSYIDYWYPLFDSGLQVVYS